ncbi:MAG: methylthioribulose 1-phosphate dehydratase [Myxococcales bacterium]|nr:MAG: methylthioribulose 1-phosphate dehydratase [Myxococcales bacterium]
MMGDANLKSLVSKLCRSFYQLGWVSGTGGGVSIRQGETIYMAPSGVQKEMLSEEDIFTLDAHGKILGSPKDKSLKLSACKPLFMHAFELRDAGAVIHSHSQHALLASLLWDREFSVTQLEMIKGIAGMGFYDRLVVPIIENTAHEADLADSLAQAIKDYPQSYAVLVKAHGVYVWGKDWIQAKTHAECYDYLFDAAVRMKQLGIETKSSSPKTKND